MTSATNFDWDAVYRSAVAQLSPELQSRASAERSDCDSAGKWRIRDQRGAILGHATPTRALAVHQAPALSPELKKVQVTAGLLEEVVTGIGKLIGQTQKAIGETQKALADCVQALSERVKAIERRGTGRGIRWCGGFSRDARYDRGDLISYGGSLWICCADDCTSMPMADQNWQRLLRANKNGTFSEGEPDVN